MWERKWETGMEPPNLADQIYVYLDDPSWGWKSFQSKEGSAKMSKQKKCGKFYNTKLYFKMHILFAEILSPKINFIYF